MPGILPMKMIRVGSSAQSRIAQACDRCRSKKIRCDGVRPTCTQCSNVGFECKTSDKLSRRAFPRGYTESLEDRVRGLEAEVRELKDLLDEKDEKIDMLSRIHNFSSPSRKCSASLSPSNASDLKAEVKTPRDEILHIEIPAPVQQEATSTGSTTTLALIEAFEQKVSDDNKQSPNASSSALLSPPQHRHTAVASSKTLPRILSDQYINIFFQEWHPILPVVHRPSFLKLYEQYLAGSDAGHWQSNKPAIAQLFLVFEIAALSAGNQNKHSVPSYEHQWRRALYSTSSGPTLASIQCQVLAQLCYLLRADYTPLTRHRGIAIGMCHEMGLHQGHKYYNLTTLEAETRKRVFWCQYVLDKFTSAATSAPCLLRDDNITTEYPADVDDVNINTQGFSPSLPGELTKVSSALALFRVSKILSKVLENLYPNKASYQLSLNKLHALSDELDQWSEELPEHLRLRFCNDKPATNVISCRSPILSLAYFFTRSLIHRPLLCHATGSSASAATIVLAAAGKHVLQILDLLDERRMNYTFPFSRREMILTSGLSILFQCLGLEQDSKIVKDNVKSLTLAARMLYRESQGAAIEFQRIVCAFVRIEAPPTPPTTTMPAPSTQKIKSPRKQLQAITSRFTTSSSKGKTEESRRATVPQTDMTQPISPFARNGSTASLSSTRSAPVLPMTSPVQNFMTGNPRHTQSPSINLDYFPFGDESHSGLHRTTSSSTMLPISEKPNHATPNIASASWEDLLSGFDGIGNQSNGYLDMNSGMAADAHDTNLCTLGNDWMQSDGWTIPPMDLYINAAKAPVPQSLMSFSEESMTTSSSNGDDLVFSAALSNSGSIPTPPSATGSTTANMNGNETATYKGISIPIDHDDDFVYRELDV